MPGIRPLLMCVPNLRYEWSQVGFLSGGEMRIMWVLLLLLTFHSLLLSAPARAAPSRQGGSGIVPSLSESVLHFSDVALGAGYRFRKGDLLVFRVYGQAEVNRRVRVDGRGMIRLHMIEGEIRAAGLTQRELRREIIYRQQKSGGKYHFYIRLLEYGTEPERIAVRQLEEGGGAYLLTTPMYFASARLDMSLTVNLRSMVWLGFSFSVLSAPGEDGWRRELSVSLDGKEYESLGVVRAEPGLGPIIDGDGGVITKGLRLRVPASTLARVAEAGKVRMRLGIRDFELSGTQLEVIRYLASRLRR